MIDQRVEPNIQPTPSGAGTDDNLESRLLLLGLLRRKGVLAVWAVVCLVVGVLAGRMLGKSTYLSQTSLIYDQVAWQKAWNQQAPGAATIIGMARLPANLQEVRQRVHAGVSAADLDQALSVGVDGDTGLLDIKIYWTDPALAAELANVTRTVLLKNLRASLEASARQEVAFLQKSLAGVTERLYKANTALQTFLITNHVTAADFMGGAGAVGTRDIELSYLEAVSQRNALAAQLQGISQTMELMRTRMAQEQVAAKEVARNSQVAQRSSAIFSVMEQERQRQANRADLLQSRIDLDRAHKLRDRGLISQEEYERAATAHERQEALASRASQFVRWRGLQNVLANAAIAPPAVTASQSSLEQMLMQSQTVRLQLQGLNERVNRLAAQVAQARRTRTQFPSLQKDYLRLSHDTARLETERNEIEGRLARAQQAVNPPGEGVPGLVVVNDAEPASSPVRSRARMITVIVAFGGLVLGLAALAGLEVRQPHLRAPAEVPLKLGMPVLASLPRGASAGGDLDSALVPAARRLREALPQVGARILLLGGSADTSLVAATMARAFVREGNRVVIVDASGLPAQTGPRRHLNLTRGPVLGLDAFLQEAARHPEMTDLDLVLWSGDPSGVHCLSLVDEQGKPVPVATGYLKTLLDSLSSRYSIVLMQASPEQDGPAQLLRDEAQGAVMVARAREDEISTLRKDSEKLGQLALGAVVTNVEPVYARLT